MPNEEILEEDIELLQPGNRTNWYGTIEEAKRRLEYTVVLYDGKPVYVDEILGAYPDGLIRAFIRDIPLMDKPPKRKIISSPKFDFKPFPLGYIPAEAGLHKETVFFERIPARKYQQGLTHSNSQITFPSGSTNEIVWSRLLYSNVLNQLIENDYPRVDDVLDAVFENIWDNEPIICPVERNFAVFVPPQGGVAYLLAERFIPCGVWLERDRFVLSTKMQFLKERISKSIGLNVA